MQVRQIFIVKKNIWILFERIHSKKSYLKNKNDFYHRHFHFLNHLNNSRNKQYILMMRNNNCVELQQLPFLLKFMQTFEVINIWSLKTNKHSYRTPFLFLILLIAFKNKVSPKGIIIFNKENPFSISKKK